MKPKLPANFEEDTWAKLKAAVKAVHNKQPVAASLEELYRVRQQLKGLLALPKCDRVPVEEVKHRRATAVTRCTSSSR